MIFPDQFPETASPRYMPALPLRLWVKNNSEFSKSVTLFDPASSQEGIEIGSGVPGISYKEMLRWIAVSKKTVGRLYLHVLGLDGHACNLKAFFDNLKAFLTGVHKCGDIYERYLPFMRDRAQIQKNVAVETIKGYAFDQHTRLLFNMPPKSLVYIDIYPEPTKEGDGPSAADFNKEFGEALTFRLKNLSEEPIRIRLFDPEFSADGFVLE